MSYYRVASLSQLMNMYNGLSHDMIVQTFSLNNDEFYEWATHTYYGRGFHHVSPIIEEEKEDDNFNIVRNKQDAIMLLRNRLVECLDINYVIKDIKGYTVKNKNNIFSRVYGDII